MTTRAPRPRGGDDPTRDRPAIRDRSAIRDRPGGSRTETAITEQSELGSDGAGDDLERDDRNVRGPRRTNPRATR
jgi:hypothetical protein